MIDTRSFETAFMRYCVAVRCMQCVACSALQCVAVPQHDALQQSYSVILRLQYDAMQHTKISQKGLGFRV